MGLRKQRRIHRAGFAFVAVTLAAPAQAAGRVLPKEAGAPIFAALHGLGPGWTLVSARIERDSVWASQCRAEDQTRCFAMKLDDPRAGCTGTTTGPFCLTFPDGAPPDDARSSLLAALGALHDDAIWQDPATVRVETAAASSRDSSTHEPPPPEQVTAHPALLASVLVLAPVGLGLGLGLGIRRVLARSRAPSGHRHSDYCSKRVQTALAALPFLLGILAIPAVPRLGAWDTLVVGLGLSVGLMGGVARASGRELGQRVALTLASLLLTFGLLEAASRMLPPPAATFPPASQARLFFDGAPGAEACAPMYPAEYPGAFAARTRGIRRGTPLVLHVGDSMVEGVGVSPEQAFPALLGQMDPGVDHVNAGFASSSLDAELLVVRAWLDRLSASRVVLYVFGYNDLSELDRTYPCCPGGPLLDASPSARARCPVAGLPSARLELLAGSPAPYPVRVATGISALARQSAVGFAKIGSALHARPRGATTEPEARWDRYATVMRALRDELAARKTPLTVVYLPARAALEGGEPRATGDYALRGRIQGLCGTLGIPMLDPWETLETAVQKEGASHWYLPPPDIHFTPEGHRLMADWLARQRY